jgi:hypothetical protein
MTTQRLVGTHVEVKGGTLLAETSTNAGLLSAFRQCLLSAQNAAIARMCSVQREWMRSGLSARHCSAITLSGRGFWNMATSQVSASQVIARQDKLRVWSLPYLYVRII